MLDIGVTLQYPFSKSIYLLDRLSTIKTSCPRFDNLKAKGHPMNPSPPATIIF